ncbi:MAG: VWA domain-containing protein, partial [Bacteroidetes bacterium]|nr:VWA domain-containing protein [Bacteroidota bacterium]
MKRFQFVVLLTLAFVPSLYAQPNLIFKRIEVTYPTISLAFKATCNGSFRNDIQPEQYEVYENGLRVKDATLYCPPEPECCVSVSMVFDRSGSMLEFDKLQKMQTGGIAFVNSMNPDGLPCDEAAVISFREYVEINQAMTTSKPDLINAISAFKAEGRTAVWDAVAVGIQELVMSATNRCKAVIVLTDGGDNSSQYFLTVQAVAQFALTHGVKVFTIGYALQHPSHGAALEYLANVTGGSYYFTPADQDL